MGEEDRSQQIEVVERSGVYKSRIGYITLQGTSLTFIGPDRKLVQLATIEQYLKVADIVQATGCPIIMLLKFS